MTTLPVSINGADNIGKTTQMNLLPRDPQVKLPTGLHDYSEDWNTIFNGGQGRCSQWWFTESTHEQHVAVLMGAVCSRYVVCVGSQDESTVDCVAVFDRGAIMFAAVCTATIALKEPCSLSKAREIYTNVLKKLDITPPNESVRILLKHSNNLKESVGKTLAREESVSETYRSYQMLLHEQLLFQEHNRDYTHVLSVNGRSALEVQNEIRAILRGSIPTIGNKLFSSMLSNLTLVVAFGGMSEAGKSTIASKTCEFLSSIGQSTTRLKIAYFMELVSKEMHSNAYNLNSNKQATELLKQIDHYAGRHYWLDTITIESLHRFGPTVELKNILGDRLYIVYVDTTLETRLHRATETEDAFMDRDETKLARGADKIKDAADHVLCNNSGTVAAAVVEVCNGIRERKLLL